MRRERDAEAELNLPPGFRFHPTDEELVVHYLCRKISYQTLPVPIIVEIDLYKYNPWQLPDLALFGTKEWYFFTPRDRKYPNGSRPNRAAGNGYWKATGADKPIRPAGSAKNLGIKKALVFYSGKAPKGVKTDWIMHEYRLAEPKRPVGSFEAVEDAGSDSFTTLESDVDNDSHAEMNGDSIMTQHKLPQSPNILQPTKNEVQSMFQTLDFVKEDNDWFMDLNLGDLQNSVPAFGATPTPDLAFQDYSLLGLTSPQFKPYQTNLLPFWSS